jgi:hypothetical protein
MANLSNEVLEEIGKVSDSLFSASSRIDNVLSKLKEVVVEADVPAIGVRHKQMPDGSVQAYVPDPEATQRFADKLMQASSVWSRILKLQQ